MIDGLLQLNPVDRLGYGEEGTLTSLTALMQHPFFKDMPKDYCFGGRPVPDGIRDFYGANLSSAEESKAAESNDSSGT
jgi:hypothetical protein